MISSAAPWKIDIESEKETIRIPTFAFAIDSSGSTGGGILASEIECAIKISQLYEKDHQVISWSHYAVGPRTLKRAADVYDIGAGTNPSSIFDEPKAIDCIKEADIVVLMTDGEITDWAVRHFAEQATKHQILACPYIFIIYENQTHYVHDSTNLSVGLTCFAMVEHAVIIHVKGRTMESSNYRVVDAKGIFQNWKESSIANGSNFIEKVNETCNKPLPKNRSYQGQTLGSLWRQKYPNIAVDVKELVSAKTATLQDEEINVLLADEEMQSLILTCKLRGLIDELRKWLKSLKIEYRAVPFEDIAGAGKIISLLGATADESSRKDLQSQLANAHKQNLDHRTHTLATNHNQDVISRNQSIDQALQTLSVVEKSTYSEEILTKSKSNRAMRAQVVDQSIAVDFNLDGPSESHYKGTCDICCGDNCIMSISIKATTDVDENTNDFCLNFPLAVGSAKHNRNLISAPSVCYQCAKVMFSMNGRNGNNEAVVSIIPTIAYDSRNAVAFKREFTIALTGGLMTGASGIGQLFIAILEHCIQEKEWADQPLLRWMQQSILDNLSCRQTFNDQGPWVTFKEAMAWSVEDFRTNAYNSWIISYPLEGYMVLRNLIAKNVVDDSTIHAMDYTKLVVHLITLYNQKYYNLIGKPAEEQRKQHHEWMKLIFHDFNDVGTPKDKQTKLTNEDFVTQLQAIGDTNTKAIITVLSDDISALKNALQLIVYHCIQHIRQHRSPLNQVDSLMKHPDVSIAIKEPRCISESYLQQQLDGMFLLNYKEYPTVPFATIYGASVLHGLDPITDRFDSHLDERLRKLILEGNSELKDKEVEGALVLIRDKRANYMKTLYATDKYIGETGFPQAITKENATYETPTSSSYNLHISMVKEWNNSSQEEKSQIIQGTHTGLVRRIIARICQNDRRGNIYTSVMEQDCFDLIPSFMDALNKQVKEGQSLSDIEIDLSKNKIWNKVQMELATFN